MDEQETQDEQYPAYKVENFLNLVDTFMTNLQWGHLNTEQRDLAHEIEHALMNDFGKE